MSNPTDVIQQVRRDMIRPVRKHARKVMIELLGPDADDRQIGLCEMSVIHQCLALGFRKGRGMLASHFAKGRFTKESIEELAGHITRFSLAGIKAVRKGIEAKRT
jgi:hypothetical protein